MSSRTLFRPALTAVSVAIAIAAFAACGDDEKNKTPTTSELFGTWKANVPLHEIADLASGDSPLGPHWEITLQKDGGLSGGPWLTYVNKEGDVDGGYAYKVSGDRITITDTNCSSGTAKSVYSFAVDGTKLKFTPVNSTCADQVLDDLLSARPWRRV